MQDQIAILLECLERVVRQIDHAATTHPRLLISRAIIEAHDGHLWAAPNDPRGAVLQFVLPAAAKAVGCPAAHHATDAGATSQS